MADLGCVVEEKGYGPDDALSWIARQWQRQSDGAGISLAIAATASDEALGCIGLLYRPEAGLVPSADSGGDGLTFEPDRRMVGIGYWVIERAQGHGLATRAVSLLSDWALEEAGIARVEALTEPENIASQRVLERSGFIREGRLASYLVVPDGRADALIYARSVTIKVLQLPTS